MIVNVSFIPLQICVHIASLLLFGWNRIVVGHTEVLQTSCCCYVGEYHAAMEQSSSWNYVIST